jgi:hypothetical protein
MGLGSKALRDEVGERGSQNKQKATANQQATAYLVCATVIRPENI